MESSNVVSSKVRELCEAVSQEENPEQMSVLVNELIRVLDEPQQQGAEANRMIANCQQFSSLRLKLLGDSEVWVTVQSDACDR